MFEICCLAYFNFYKSQGEAQRKHVKDGTHSLLSRSLSSSDLHATEKDCFDLAATSPNQNDKYPKSSKTNRKYSKRLSQKHYHTMQISYPIDEPSGLLPTDVDPPFDGELETDTAINASTTNVVLTRDHLQQPIQNSDNPNAASLPLIDLKSANYLVKSRSKSSNRGKNGARKKERLSGSESLEGVKSASLPPENHLDMIRGISDPSSSSKSVSNGTSPISSTAASPEVKKSSSKSFFPTSNIPDSLTPAPDITTSGRSKSEDVELGRNKTASSKTLDQTHPSSSNPPTQQATLPGQISHSTRRILAMEDQRNLDWQITKSKLTERSAHLLETGLWTDCEFHVGLPPNIKVRTIT